MKNQRQRPLNFTRRIWLAPILMALLLPTSGCRFINNSHCGSCEGVARKINLSSSSRVAKLQSNKKGKLAGEFDTPSSLAKQASNENSQPIKQVSYVEGEDDQVVAPVAPLNIDTHRFPVDLATVLQLAGADNWNVRIARQQICEAAANVDAAKSAILPSLNLGAVYNVHEGEIQETDGNIITATRSSLFLGGGAGIANSPLNGGSGGPARLFVDFSLAEALFKPLAARQRLDAARANRCRVLNDTLLEATLAYYELVRGQSSLAVADKNLEEALEVKRLTEAFIESGKGSQADVHRVNVIVNNRRQQVIQAKTAIEVASARLAEVLQLDPCEADPEIGLIAIELQPMVIQIIDWSIDLNSYVDMAQSTRCEIAQELARTRAMGADHEAEIWRSILPNLYLGYSGGVFGGGSGGGGLGSLDLRHDVDVALIWQIKNLGFGNSALQNLTRSQQKKQLFKTRQVRDKISQQVTTTFHSTQRYQQEMDLYQDNIEQSEQALSKNIEAIRGLEGLPLEAIQSLDAVAGARLDYLNAIVNYNQWQLRLLRAIGQPFADCGESGNCACINPCQKCTSRNGSSCCDCQRSNKACR